MYTVNLKYAFAGGAFETEPAELVLSKHNIDEAFTIFTPQRIVTELLDLLEHREAENNVAMNMLNNISIKAKTYAIELGNYSKK